MHLWGDGFDFDGLHRAGCQIAAIYELLTGEHLYWKEKYGTIRYESYSMKHMESLVTAVALTVIDYPEFSKELLSEFMFLPIDKCEAIDKLRRNKDGDGSKDS